MGTWQPWTVSGSVLAQEQSGEETPPGGPKTLVTCDNEKIACWPTPRPTDDIQATVSSMDHPRRRLALDVICCSRGNCTEDARNGPHGSGCMES